MNIKNAGQATKHYYDEIDALKGIAIFLVVLGHSIILYPINLHENVICEFIFKWLSSVHMPLFFIISGFCFSYVNDYKTYIWKKAQRLLIPYIAFNMLDMLPRKFFPSLVNRDSGLGESVNRIIFSGGEFWFLYTLFFIFIFFPLLYKLLTKNIYCAISVLIAAFLLYCATGSISIFLINRATYYLLYIIIGVIVKAYIGDKIFDIKISMLKSILSAVILLVIWLLLFKLNMPYVQIIKALVGIAFFYVCMQCGMIVQMFKGFGKYSLQIYLLNGFLLVISRTIIVSLLGITVPLVIILFNMLVDFVLSYLFIKYICAKIKPVRFIMGMTL